MSEGQGERPSWTRVKRSPRRAVPVAEALTSLEEMAEACEADQQRVDEDALFACALGAAVQEQRLWLCWSQSRLAAEAGVDEGTVSRLECGRYLQPALRTLRKLAAALCLEVSELMQLAEQLMEAGERADAPIAHRSLTAL